MKRLVVVAFALATGFAGVASAQWATFDASNFMQNMRQVEEMVQQLDRMDQQLTQMRRQVDQAKQTYDSTVGSRGMGLLQTDTNRGYMNSMWDPVSASTQSSQVLGLANRIKQQAGYLSSQDLAGINEAYRERLMRESDDAATEQAMHTLVFQHSGEQFARIDSLMSEIELAHDPKAIADLQARVAVEQAQLQAQLQQAQAMAAMLDSKRRVEEAQQMQRVMSESMDYYKGN